jgi:hypothetical protein
MVGISNHRVSPLIALESCSARTTIRTAVVDGFARYLFGVRQRALKMKPGKFEERLKTAFTRIGRTKMIQGAFR